MEVRVSLRRERGAVSDLVGRRRDSYTPCAGSAERMSHQPPHTGIVIIFGNFSSTWIIFHTTGNVHN